MKHPVLLAEHREILGKKVKKLRREGFLPANIYGKDMKSTAIQITLVDFQKIYNEVGETGIIDVTVDNIAHPSLIKNLQWNYQAHLPLHADFFKVNLKEKIRAMVPVTLTGEAEAVKENTGTLLHILNEIEVEALPEKLPDQIEVDITKLAQVDDQILVSEISVPQDVTIVSDGGQLVAKIAELVAPEPEPEVVVEEGTEGETPEGESTEETASEEESPAEENA
jgi:large subunit ribosomal protein L25